MLQDGDEITVDVQARKLTVKVTEEEFAERRKNLYQFINRRPAGWSCFGRM